MSARRASIAANSSAPVGPRQLDTLRRFADAPPRVRRWRASGALPMRILRGVAVVAVAGWLGIMAFFSFGVAPLVFKTIDRAVAGQAVAAVLPRYYVWGLVLCGIALAACVVQTVSGSEGRLRPLIGAGLCGAMCGLLVWASTAVMPRAEAARRSRDDEAFARAHRASVQLNSATMLTGAALLLLETLSRSARRDR